MREKSIATISIIEWGVYGFVCYSSILMLIISTIKEIPESKFGAYLRSVFMIPGVVCAGILGSSGVNIQLNSDTVSSIIKDLNNTDTWSQNITNTSTVILQNPIWQSVHYMFMIVLVVYIFVQILTVLTKGSEKKTI